MKNSKPTLFIRSSKLFYLTQILMGVVTLIAAIYFFLSKETFLGVLFSVVALELIVLGSLTKKMYVRADGSIITFKSMISKTTIDISQLVAASVIPSRNGGQIKLQNIDNQKIQLTSAFNKQDLTKLADYLWPYVNKPSVEKDKNVKDYLSNLRG